MLDCGYWIWFTCVTALPDIDPVSSLTLSLTIFMCNLLWFTTLLCPVVLSPLQDWLVSCNINLIHLQVIGSSVHPWTLLTIVPHSTHFLDHRLQLQLPPYFSSPEIPPVSCVYRECLVKKLLLIPSICPLANTLWCVQVPLLLPDPFNSSFSPATVPVAGYVILLTYLLFLPFNPILLGILSQKVQTLHSHAILWYLYTIKNTQPGAGSVLAE